MRNRELGVLIIGLLCIALPAVTEWLLPLHGLEPDLGTSSMYTEQERMDAAKAVARYCDNELLQLTYLGDGQTPRLLELTWLRDWDRAYNLGDNEFHLAFRVDDFAAAHHQHEQMGCICFENPSMGIYFISDPDGYWLEIIPGK